MSNHFLKKAFLVTALMLSVHSAADEDTSADTTTANENLLELNKAMLPIYENELTKFQAKFLNTHPVIIARFSGEGGHLALYRPGKEPLVASPPPIAYQLAKSVGHAVMISYEMSEPYVTTSDTDMTWKPQMSGFQSKVANALNTLDDIDMTSSDKKILRDVLTIINNYLTKCITQNKVDQADLDAFGLKTRPYLLKLIKISAYAQAHHQMAVIAEWKKLLGKEWENTYAATNSMFVTRQNNLLFSMLAEFMGKDAINHRLMLFETTTFSSTDEVMLNLLARVMSDRGLAITMLGNYYAMDSELLANGGRQIIIDEAKKYNLPIILPDEEPFNSTDWPWRHNKNSGSGPANFSQIK